MQKYTWIIFDFNGTIYNDLPISVKIANYYLKQAHKPLTNVEEYRQEFEFPAINYYKKKGLVIKDEDFDYYKNDYPQRYLANETISLAPHAHEVLTELKKTYHLALISILNEEILQKQCVQFKIAPYFEAILGQNNVDSASKLETAQHFAKENNLPPKKILFIGDTMHDYEVAADLGAACLLYDQGYQSHQILETSGCPVISDFDEIKKYL